MSLALYTRRIYWDGLSGAMRAGNVCRQLVAPPALPGLALRKLTEIDYAPEVHVAQLREGCDRHRDMTAPEVAAAEQLLDGLANDDSSDRTGGRP